VIKSRVLGVFLSVMVLACPAPAQDAVTGLPSAPARWERGKGTLAAGGRSAVVVAADVNDRHEAWALPSARTSAEALRAQLADCAGIAPARIALLCGRDVHPDAVRSAIAAAGERAGGADGALLYVHWLGHGWVEDGELQLFGFYTDEAGAGFAPAVTRRQLVSWLGEAETKARVRGVELQTVLVVDACRVARGAPPPKAKLLQSHVFELYGGKDGEMVAAGGGGEGFAFTGALGAAMAALASSGEAGLDVVFREARDRTLRATTQRQEPVMTAPPGRTPTLVAPARVTFAVRTVDALSGARVEAARLRCDDRVSAITDAAAVLTATPGPHQLTVHAEGYLSRTEALVLDRGHDDAELTLSLLPALTIVRGRLVPPAVLGVRAHGVASPRRDYHVHEAVSAPDGRFELRLGPGAGATLEVVAKGEVLQAQPLPPPTSVAAGAGGGCDAVPVIEVVVPLGAAALAASGQGAAASGLGGAAAGAPAALPSLDDPLDRSDWERARAAIAADRFELARDDLRGIPSQDPALLAWRRWVDLRWARAVLERALRTGIAIGDFAGVDEVRQWLSARSQGDAGGDVDGLRALLAEVDREQIPLGTRHTFTAANAAVAAGELELALQGYGEALTGANAHYRSLIEAEIGRIRDRLYDRHMNAGAARELAGDLDAAWLEYAAALRFSARARTALARAARDPRLRRSPEVVAAGPQVEALLAAAADVESGDRTLYERLSFAAAPSVEDWLAKANDLRRERPEGDELFRSLALSLAVLQKAVVGKLASARQGLRDVTGAADALAAAHAALLGADEAGLVAARENLVTALADCEARGQGLSAGAADLADAAGSYFPEWREKVVATYSGAVKSVMMQTVEGRAALVAAAGQAVRRAEERLRGATAPIAEQIAFATTHTAAATRLALRSRHAALREAVAAVRDAVAEADLAVETASTHVQRASH